ncbi:MAG: DegT/DnrJ/EryC1/StrS family aminotransferase [Lachnospiraceae bacterium]|nr:DegT/DnrJ/EryC1/StrS family aminotransferase [Lachnospiraceae bacterium]
MNKCAILGGKPVREEPIPWMSTMGKEESEAVLDVMKSGVLSSFLANSGDQFLGGPRVRQIEEDFCKRFGSKHAISVNSATTALHTAVAACGIGPGDEVLVSPYTMVASASAILMNCAVPIFVDIDPDTYTINPDEIEKWITPHTKAILTVNIFGLPSNLPRIMDIAKKHNLFVIEDNAQSPGATINGSEAGTIADIGVFSLNYHKIIHSGEGGIILTNNDELARMCQLIRNHGEVALDEENDMEAVVLGNNIRMSELHAAVGIEQLKKLDHFLSERRILAQKIDKGLNERIGLKAAYVPKGYTHSYYVYPIQFDAEKWGISRGAFARAMEKEGFPLGVGYVKPIYLMNLYKHKRVFNQTTYPFKFIEKPTQDYKKGLCPVVEAMHYEKLLTADICRYPFKENDIDDFFTAIDKIWEERKDIGLTIKE